MKIESLLIGFGILIIIIGILSFFNEITSFSMMIGSFIGGLLLIGLGKLLMMIEHYEEKKIELLNTLNNELLKDKGEY